MVSALTWGLLGFGLYWLVVGWSRRQGLLPDNISTQGPILLLHTKRFRALLDRLAHPRRLWRLWGNLGVGIAYITMTTVFLFLAIAAYSTWQNPPPQTAVNQPRNVLVIPGVNEFLPISAAPEIVFGLLAALVVHEGGHGIMCRVGDIDINSVGLGFLAVIPIAAFVEPDEDSRRAANRGDQSRMFAAGVMNNFLLTVVAYALLFGPLIGTIAVAPGVAIGGTFPGSPAAQANLTAGDRITEVNGQEISDEASFRAALNEIETGTVTLGIESDDGTKTAEVTRSVFVTGVTAETPFASTIAPKDRIASVNGTSVETVTDFQQAVADRRVATVETADGEMVTGPVGATVTIIPEDPAAEAGIPTGAGTVITAIDEHRVASAEQLTQALDATEPGQVVTVEYYRDGNRSSQAVTLGSSEGQEKGYLGVRATPGYSGISITDFGIKTYPAELYLGLLGGDGDRELPFLLSIVLSLQLPLANVAGGLPYNFAGFTGWVANFYVIPGVPAPIEGILFFVTNAMFWTGWINLNLAVFNCIPAFPLDGGHLLRMAAEAGVSRIPISDRRELTTVITTGIGLVMLVSLLITFFGPQLLT